MTVGILLRDYTLATAIPPSVLFLMLSLDQSIILFSYPTWPGLPLYLSCYCHLNKAVWSIVIMNKKNNNNKMGHLFDFQGNINHKQYLLTIVLTV